MKQARLLHRLLSLFVACVLVCLTAAPAFAYQESTAGSSIDDEHYDALDTLEPSGDGEGGIYNPVEDIPTITEPPEEDDDTASSGEQTTPVTDDTTQGTVRDDVSSGEDTPKQVAGANSVSVSIEVQNRVYGAKTGKAFQFQLSNTSGGEGAVMPSDTVLELHGESSGYFLPITFTEEGVWEFEVMPIIGSEETGGIRRDTRTYNVRIEVTTVNDALAAVETYTRIEGGAEVSTSGVTFAQLCNADPKATTSTTAKWAQVLYDRMTPEERVGQLFLLHYPGDGAGTVAQATSAINTYHPGGFVFFKSLFGNGNEDSTDVATVTGVQQKLQAAQDASNTPLIMSIDEEGGLVVRAGYYNRFLQNYYGANYSRFPSALELWQERDLSLITDDAIAKSEMLRDLGFNLNHAPVADVPMSENGYMYQRERVYSTNVHEVADCVQAVVQGAQSAGVASTLKHFPGYCDPSGDTHAGVVVNDATSDHFYFEDLVPFYAGVEAGAEAVMITHNIIECLDAETPASISEATYRLLREELGFEGLAITDDLAMRGVIDAAGSEGVALTALTAGADMVIMPLSSASLSLEMSTEYASVLDAYTDDVTFQGLVQDKVLRILGWKIEQGLIDISALDDDVETEAPDTAEAVWISENRADSEYGTFLSCLAKSVSRGGTCRLLKDVSPRGSLPAYTAEDSAQIDLNGYCLDLSSLTGNRFANLKLTLMSSKDTVHVESHDAIDTQTPYYTWYSNTKTLEYYNGASVNLVDVSGLGTIRSTSTIPLFENVELDVDSVIFEVRNLTRFSGEGNRGGVCFTDCLFQTTSVVNLDNVAGDTSFNRCYFVDAAGVTSMSDSDIELSVNNSVFLGGTHLTVASDGMSVSLRDTLFAYMPSYALRVDVGAEDVAVLDCDFLYNESDAVRLIKSRLLGGTLLFSGCAFKHNTGSAISGDVGYSLVIDSCTIENSQTSALALTMLSDDSHEGALKFEGTTHIKGNVSDGNGGGIKVTGSAQEVKINGILNLSENTATLGGGFYLEGVACVVVGELHADHNTARTGAGVYAKGGSFTVQGNYVATENEAESYGGGLATEISNLVVATGATALFTQNVSVLDGAGLRTVLGSFTNNGIVTADYNRVTEGSGGGISLWGTTAKNNGQLNVTNNTATNNGGGLSLVNGTANLSGNVVVCNNSIASADTTYGSGGGIYAEYCELNLGGAFDVCHNSARRGAGIAIVGASTNTGDGTVHDNVAAVAGGGLYIRGINSSSVGFSGTVDIYANQSATSGGGIYTTLSGLDLSGDWSVRENVAKNDSGGGIFIEKEATIHEGIFLHGNGLISRNTAALDGGGICANNCAIVCNDTTVIEDNKCARRGGGIAFNAAGKENSLDRLEMYDEVRIRRNEAGFGYNGSGVYANVSDIRVSGIVRIVDNVKYDKYGVPSPGGIAIADNAAVSVVGELDAESRIVINPFFFTEERVLVGSDTRLVDEDRAYWKDVFISSDPEYNTIVDGRTVFLSLYKKSDVHIVAYVNDEMSIILPDNNLYKDEDGSWALKLENGKLPEAIAHYGENLEDKAHYTFAVLVGDLLHSIQSVSATETDFVSVPYGETEEPIRIQLLSHGAKGSNYGSPSELQRTFGFYSVFIDDLFGAQFEDIEAVQGTYYVPILSDYSVTLPIHTGSAGWRVTEENGRFGCSVLTVNGHQTFSLTNIEGPVVISSGATGAVTFTVQQYAYTQTFDKSDASVTGTFPVIDTSGRRLPVNGTQTAQGVTGFNNGRYTYNIINLRREDDGSIGRSQGISPNRAAMSFICYDQLNFAERTAQEGFLGTDDDYILREVWVLKNKNDNPSSMDESQWDIWRAADGQELSDLVFTANPEYADSTGAHLLTSGDVVRLVYDHDAESSSIKVATNFYDYDVSDGSYYNGGYLTIDTGEYGIHTNSNYLNSDDQNMARFCFGNGSIGTKHRNDLLPTQTSVDGRTIDTLWSLSSTSKINIINDGNYGGAIYGLVTGLDANGNLIYRDGMNTLPLFAEDLYTGQEVKGKTRIDDLSLVFDRVGDTYTLESVYSESQGRNILTNLSKLQGIQDWRVVYSNLFWPLDNLYSDAEYQNHDPQTIGYDGAVRFNGMSASTSLSAINGNMSDGYNSGTMPRSDGYGRTAHNFYFGMDFMIDFRLSENYVGDLEFAFYGDDDLWVFLDDQLICDIGGVHTSLGIYADLWDYIEPGDTDVHRIKVFYLERGGSGATCWMQLTAPNVTFLDVPRDTPLGTFTLSKEVNGAEQYIPEDAIYEFDLFSSEIDNDVPYTVVDHNGDTISRGLLRCDETSIVSLKAGWSATFTQVPAGRNIDITEHQYDCAVTVDVNDELTLVEHETNSLAITIQVQQGGLGSVVYTNTYSNTNRLPEAGGSGTWWFYLIGCGCLVAPIVISRRREHRI